MTEIEILKNKRSVIKGKLARLQNFVANFDWNEEIQELKVRVSKIQASLDENFKRFRIRLNH